MRVLIINDDGVTVPGIATLYDVLADHTDYVVVALDQDESGASNSPTLDRPLHPQRLDSGFISFNGASTDCMRLGLNGLLEELSDMVVSGINLGANLGDDILCSDIVAAATKGCFLKGSAFAFSLTPRLTDNLPTVVHFARLLTLAHEHLAVPPYTMLNVNIPNLPLDRVHGIQLTRLGHRARAATPVKVVNPRGKEGYWTAVAGDVEDGGPGTDFHTAMQDYMSTTPLRLDHVFHKAFSGLDEWLGGLT